VQSLTGSCQFGVINEVWRDEGKTNLRKTSVSSSSSVQSGTKPLIYWCIVYVLFSKGLFVCWRLYMKCYAKVVLCEDRSPCSFCLLFGHPRVKFLHFEACFWSRGTTYPTTYPFTYPATYPITYPATDPITYPTTYPITSAPQFIIIFKTNY
jgi:hypothetical protein